MIFFDFFKKFFKNAGLVLIFGLFAGWVRGVDSLRLDTYDSYESKKIFRKNSKNTNKLKNTLMKC
jgi:hypothetical protein